MSDQPGNLDQVEVDVSNLYREETVTDLRVATLRCLTPIKPDGSEDGSREKLFTGETTIVSQAGPLPVNFRIDAKSLEEACQKFPDSMRAAIDQLMQEAAEYRRRESSRIVTPGEVDPLGGAGLTGGVPGLPSSGKIKLR